MPSGDISLLSLPPSFHKPIPPLAALPPFTQPVNTRLKTSMASMDEKPQPVVFIIGAGLSGLLLAALLEKTHISYRVFERAAEVKPLGKKKNGPLYNSPIGNSTNW